MDINVSMTADEYDLYRAYQKEKESLERVVRADLNRLRDTHKELCSAVVDALGKSEAVLCADGEPVETSLTLTMKSVAAAGRALDLANDWFC